MVYVSMLRRLFKGLLFDYSWFVDHVLTSSAIFESLRSLGKENVDNSEDMTWKFTEVIAWLFQVVMVA